MSSNILITAILSLFTAIPGYATERAFRVFGTRSLTPLVERFYGKDGTAFATLFCDQTAPQAMIVDSRLQDLDGKTFYFTSVEACDATRTQAQQLLNRCSVALIVNQSNNTVRSQVSGCR